MGATPSKKRKERKRQKETEEVLAAVANLKEVYTKSALHPYRKSQLLDVSQDLSSFSPGYHRYSRSQDTQSSDLWWPKSSSTGEVNLLSVPPSKRGSSGSSQTLSYRTTNVDNHPVLSNLQNRQNARLEDMEFRMCEIRRHAMEAAAAQHRRARSRTPHEQGHVHVTEPVREQTFPKAAQNVTDRLKNSTGTDISEEEDSGEIIPVRVLTSQESRRAQMRQRQMSREKSPPDPLSLDLLWKGSPLLIALLPIILPVLLLSVIMKSISQSYQEKKKR